MRWCLPLLLAAACASSSGKTSWLFVHNADRAELGEGTLTLTGVNPQVVCFTDRPERRAGTLPVGEFLRAWEGSGVFVDVPPNATVAVFGGEEVREAVLVLRNPRLAGETLTYDVEVIGGKIDRAGPAALFIDSVGSGTPVVRHGMHREPGVVIRRGMHLVR